MGKPRENSVAEMYVGSNYAADEVEFLLAIDAFKRDRRRPFPTWCEVLTVLKTLGYRKVEPETQPEGAPCPSPADSPRS